LKPIRLVRMAWAGAIMATTSGLLYLAYGPVPLSHATDGMLALSVYLLGGVLGATIEAKLENSISLRRSKATVLRQPRDGVSLERSVA
jgi:hypothetical protein